MSLLLLVILVILVIGLLPVYPYSRSWGTGYYPSAGIGTILVILLILYFLGIFR